MSSQITTLTLCKYQGFRNKVWAFGMMQFAHKHLQGIEGLSFYKLMGSGKGLGFSPLPDWGMYCLLQVWENEKQAEKFLDNSPLIEHYKDHTSQQATLFMRSRKSHGKWSGTEPFEVSSELDESNDKMAVITRATIKNKNLLKFWKYVPTSQRPIKNAEGLMYTKGIGEIPIKQMATFSLWNSMEDVRRFAYNSKEHKQAIKMTRELDWYSEELFARFQPYKLVGEWEGIELI